MEAGEFKDNSLSTPDTNAISEIVGKGKGALRGLRTESKLNTRTARASATPRSLRCKRVDGRSGNTLTDAFGFSKGSVDNRGGGVPSGSPFEAMIA